MAEFTKFRTALNGFNRSDVTEYIELLCSQHQEAMRNSQEEIEILTRQLADAQEQLENQTARTDGLQKQLEETETALHSTETALDEAMTLLTAPKAEETASEETDAEVSQDFASMELEAYRRAEAMERISAERASRLNQQMSDLLDEASSRYEQTGQEIQALAEDIRINLKRLEEALSDLDAIFDETAQNFDDMDPAAPVPSAD